MEKIEVVISVIFIIVAFDVIMPYAFSVQTSTTSSTCSIANIGNCFSNTKDFSYVVSIPYGFGSVKIDLTYIIVPFLFIADALYFIGSLFFLDLALPFLPSYLLYFFGAIDGVLDTILVISILPFLS